MSTQTFTFSSQKLQPAIEPDDAMEQPFKVAASTTLARGTVVGEVAASPGTVAAYASGHSDGTETPIGVVAYDVVSDADGNVFFADAARSEFGESEKTVPVFIKGYFLSAELPGLDAGAISKLGKKVGSTLLRIT